ncbi:hypothetical protein F5Y03DRAFT_122066 [Xylaria venustula]|nr:hypothetical protein F5Y03DRAFT_122066 [Xylaria venustula]
MYPRSSWLPSHRPPTQVEASGSGSQRTDQAILSHYGVPCGLAYPEDGREESSPEDGREESSPESHSEESEEPVDIAELRMIADKLEELFQERSQGQRLDPREIIQIAIDMEHTFQTASRWLEQLLEYSGVGDYGTAFSIWKAENEAVTPSQQIQEPRVEHPGLLKESELPRAMYQETIRDPDYYEMTLTANMRLGLKLLYANGHIQDRHARYALSWNIDHLLCRRANGDTQERLARLCTKVHEYQFDKFMQKIRSRYHSQP